MTKQEKTNTAPIQADTVLVPLSKLKPSPANVRRTEPDRSIAQLAASIRAHGLLQPLLVEPDRDAEGRETGCWRVVAGERRRKALRRLAKERALPRTARVACRYLGQMDAAEASLAENVERESMHPLDEADAFAALVAGGSTIAEAAHRFGVSETLVKQRLRLAALEPSLAALFRQGALSLAQAQALTLAPSPDVQRQAWAALGWNRDPDAIRRLLTQGRVSTTNRRALYVGVEAYSAAGGSITRDLFHAEGEGWLDDPVLLERLCLERLERAADTVRAEGWHWVAVSLDHPYAEASAMRQLPPLGVAEPSPEEIELRAALDALLAAWAGADMPEAVAERIDGLTRALAEQAAARRRHPDAYTVEQRQGAGAFISLGHAGTVRVERGYARPEEAERHGPAQPTHPEAGRGTGGVGPDNPAPRPLPERLVACLTAERTAALAWHLAMDTDSALLTLAHALALPLLYRDRRQSCLNIEVSPPDLARSCPQLEDTKAGQALAAARARWCEALPADGAELWTWLTAQDAATVRGLLALCTGLLADAVCTRHDGATHPADQVARLTGLDMAQWWEATAASYFAQVPKARILEAVTAARGARDAAHIAGLKRDVMAQRAERLLAGTGWLPGPLRTPEKVEEAAADAAPQAPAVLAGAAD